MKTIKGVLTRIGSSTIHRFFVQYSVIEIGDTVLQNVKVSEKLDNFLRSSLSTSGVTTLYITRSNHIAALETPTEKIYYTNTSRLHLLLTIGAGFTAFFMFSYVFGGGALALFNLLIAAYAGYVAVASWKSASATRRMVAKLSAAGGILLQ